MRTRHNAMPMPKGREGRWTWAEDAAPGGSVMAQGMRRLVRHRRPRPPPQHPHLRWKGLPGPRDWPSARVRAGKGSWGPARGSLAKSCVAWRCPAFWGGGGYRRGNLMNGAVTDRGQCSKHRGSALHSPCGVPLSFPKSHVAEPASGGGGGGGVIIWGMDTGTGPRLPCAHRFVHTLRPLRPLCAAACPLWIAPCALPAQQTGPRCSARNAPGGNVQSAEWHVRCAVRAVGDMQGVRCTVRRARRMCTKRHFGCPVIARCCIWCRGPRAVLVSPSICQARLTPTVNVSMSAT